MNKPKFTQGKWIIGNAPYGYNANTIFNEKEKSICSVFGMPLHESLDEIKKSPRFDEGVANAYLISAAPDMYAVLESIYLWFDNEDTAVALPTEPVWYQALRDALAKARGE